MPDILAMVATGYPHYSRFGQLVHAASLVERGELYIWCFGQTHAAQWSPAPEGEAPTCFLCIGAGPRGEWQDDMMLGCRGRMQMIEGEWSLTLDTETSGPRNLAGALKPPP